jgi:dTMP kinase
VGSSVRSPSYLPHSRVDEHFRCAAYPGHILTTPHRPKITKAIEQGTTVIIDRYYYSGIVYSAAKQNPSMTLEWCRHPDVGLPRPDLVLFLHISAEDAAARGGYGTERYEKKAMQDRVRELFEKVRGRKEGDDFVVIDAGGSMEDVQREIQQKTRVALGRVNGEGKALRTVGAW